MRKGKFEAAWAISDRVVRSRALAGNEHLPLQDRPVWNGTPLVGRSVLVRCHHGLGDSIQFARYLPLLRPLVRHLTVWAPPSLHELLASTGAIDRLLPLHDGEPNAIRDVDVEIMELPHVFRTSLATIPRCNPYLHSRISHIPKTHGVKVGVAWRAGSWDPTRSVPFHLLRKLAEVPDVTFYALQRDTNGEERDAGIVVDERRVSVLGTAELIRELDLVISVDSMPAHLAGALGTYTWTLLPHVADWRWMHGRSDSPWYPTMRLFRQPAPGDWESVLDAVASALLARVDARRNDRAA